MKVFFYITSIERGGGAERVICNLANQFSLAGNECTMITSHPEEVEYALEPVIRRVNLAPFRTPGFIRRNRELFSGLKKLVREEKPEVLISFMAEPNFRAVPACFGTDTKTIISVRNDPSREYPTLFHRILAKTLFKRADFAVFQTTDAKNWFPAKLRKKSEVIFNPIDEKFLNEPLSERGMDIVATGRLEPQKNHRLLIDAFTEIADKTECNLVIYGEGSLREELQSRIDENGMHDRILLPGRTTDVISSIRNAAVYVLSSDYEGMPNALMEAMALGIPCISTDCPCGGPGELIDNGKNGLLVETGNVSALSKAMLGILENSDKAAEMGRQAKTDCGKYTSSEIFKKWLGVVEKVTGK